MLLNTSTAQAADGSTYTVDSLALTKDATPGDGVCDDGTGQCTLRAALDEANAATDATAISIDFSVTGSIEIAGIADAMLPGVNIGTQNAEIGNGAQYVINSTAPVSIDFTGIDDITQTDDTNYAMFYIESDDVTLSNLGNVRAGAAGAAIAGSNVTLDAVNFSDNDSEIQEVGVAFLDGASNVTVKNAALETAFWANVMVDWDASVSNIALDNVTSNANSAFAHVIFENDSTVDGFTVTNSTFGSADVTEPAPLFYMNTPGNTITGLKFLNSTFASPGQRAFTFEGGTYTFTDTDIEGSTFTGIGQFIQGGISTVDFDGLTVKNNTFTDSTAPLLDNNAATFNDFTFADNTVTRNTGYVLNLGNSTATGVSITGNTIKDVVSGGGHTVVWLSNGDPDAGNVIDGNTFEQTGDAQTNLWAIWNQAVGIADGDNTGWTITNNHIDGYQPGVYSPIANGGVGQTIVTGNTFGPNSAGTTDTDSEWNVGYFVTNNDQANDRIQTYRPTKVVTDGTNAKLTVAPVTPALTNNTDPTEPVTLYVYWTANDTAEEYLGSVSDVSGATTITVPTTHTDGFFRVQTVDANGNSSQYSGISDEVTEAPAAPVVTETTQKTATGTGDPQASVVVRDADGNDVTDATVDADGNWTADGLDCGTTYTVVQVVDGVESDTTEFTTADCATTPTAPDAPAVTGTTDDGASGTGEPEASVVVRDADGNDVTDATVDADGNWNVDGLDCGTTYTVVQVVDGVESDTTKFTTADCAAKPTAPDAPVVTDTTDDGASGTGDPQASVVVRDSDGNDVTDDAVDADGNWNVDGLDCGTTYTVVQVENGVESDPTEFTTADCAATPASNDGDGGAGSGNLASTGFHTANASIIGGLMLMLGGIAIAIGRKRRHA